MESVDVTYDDWVPPRDLNENPYTMDEALGAIAGVLNSINVSHNIAPFMDSTFQVIVFSDELQKYADQLGIRRNYHV